MMKDKRVLYVEDQEDMRFLMTLLLEHHGFEVTTAGTAGQAAELSKQESFDIFLIDNLLPDMSGIELCNALRASGRNTPIIFFSGMEGRSNKEAAFAAGAQAYIVKPAEPDTIVEIVEHALSS